MFEKQADLRRQLEQMGNEASFKNAQARNPLAQLLAAQGQGGLPAPPGGAGAHRINSEEEFQALPSGAVFIGPDGKLRRKP